MRALYVFTALALPLTLQASCVPVAEWSGKLILPEAQNRAADGGISYLVENAPREYGHLKGQKIHLRFGKPGSRDRAWFDGKKRDVTFGAAGRKAIEVEKNQLPIRLHGWKNVSPLESLAAARDNDVIRAEISDAEVSLEDGKAIITTHTDPKLLDGTTQCLLKFESVSGATAQVRFYDQATKSFSAHSEEVNLDFKSNLYYPENVPAKTLKGIEGHRSNLQGWNAYGTRDAGGRFTVEAIESYDMLKVSIGEQDDAETKNYKNRLGYWNIREEDKTRARKIVYRSKSGAGSEVYRVGDKFLLTHNFGSYNDHGRVLVYTRGHASMGTAEITLHPITGEPVYKMIYKQTFGQWAQGTFAATFHYHAYAGNLYRGWMFHLPITDLLYPLGPGAEGFYQSFDRAFDTMAADYRTGFGSGYARITLMASCVHDSGNTLIGVLDEALASKKGNPELKRLQTLMKRRLGNQVLPDPKFRRPDTLPENIDSHLSTLAEGRKNMVITVPRNFQDELLKSFVADGRYPVVALQTVQAGDDMDGVIPRKPNRINSFTGALLGVILRGALGKWIEF